MCNFSKTHPNINLRSTAGQFFPYRFSGHTRVSKDFFRKPTRLNSTPVNVSEGDNAGSNPYRNGFLYPREF
jgi:hypothetical protein